MLGKWLRILAVDIFLREQKGARWNIKRSARLIANGNHPLATIPLRHRRSQPPSDLWSILYIRYFLLSIAPICLIYVSFRDHPRSPSAVSALPWPPSTPGQAPRVHSRAKFTPYGYGRPDRPTTGYSQGFARDANAPLY